MSIIRVLPKKDKLDGKGTVWEWLLADKGYNELSGEDKIGVVAGVFELDKSGGIVVDVYFPALNHTATDVFLDEIVGIDEEENRREVVLINKGDI